jgi:peptidoglycan/LPS O-acetylase OafA/YrhL
MSAARQSVLEPAPAAPAPRRAAAPPPPAQGFRGDIEGMRAIAIVAVLASHAGLAVFAGGYVGVDVFFVISGYLITRLLLGEVDRSATISLPRFYARRVRRLLPLAAILLMTVAALSLAIFSPLRSVEVSGDIVSSALYAANWHFAAQSVDYFAQNLEPSPVLHLWSLAIEEQFYVVWPSLLLAVTWFRRRRGLSVKPVLWVTLAIVFGGSLLFGAQLTSSDPAPAYFSTLGRAWELALGAFLALLSAPRIPRLAAAAIGWAGVAAIVYAIVAFDAQTPFPGFVALIPTLGTACLILAGSSIHADWRGAPGAALSVRPVRYVGRISYSWYLWHWPALIFAAALWGPLSPAAGVAIVLASLLPTVATHHLVENPVRHSRRLARLPNLTLLIGAGCMASAVFAGTMLSSLQPSVRTAPLAAVKGAAALPEQPQPQETATVLRPSPLRAAADHTPVISDGCMVGIEGTESHECVFGDPNGSRTVFLFGDSHAMQYFAPLDPLAKRRHWQLVVLTKRECGPTEVTVQNMLNGDEYTSCDAWRANSLRRIAAAGPGTIVVMSGYSAYTAYENGNALSGMANARALEAGYARAIAAVYRDGSEPVVIRDMPAAPQSIPSCVSENLDHLRRCSFVWNRSPRLEFDLRAAQAAPYAHLIDLTAEVCPRSRCRAVIGNALVYRDSEHLSATFARTLEPWIAAALAEAGIR